MKKVEVFSFKIDSSGPALSDKLYHNFFFKKEMIDIWTNSEEYRFIEKNSTTIEQVEIPNHDRTEVTISYHAVMEDKIEILWRLKFK